MDESPSASRGAPSQNIGALFDVAATPNRPREATVMQHEGNAFYAQQQQYSPQYISVPSSMLSATRFPSSGAPRQEGHSQGSAHPYSPSNPPRPHYRPNEGSRSPPPPAHVSVSARRGSGGTTSAPPLSLPSPSAATAAAAQVLKNPLHTSPSLLLGGTAYAAMRIPRLPDRGAVFTPAYQSHREKGRLLLVRRHKQMREAAARGGDGEGIDGVDGDEGAGLLSSGAPSEVGDEEGEREAQLLAGLAVPSALPRRQRKATTKPMLDTFPVKRRERGDGMREGARRGAQRKAGPTEEELSELARVAALAAAYRRAGGSAAARAAAIETYAASRLEEAEEAAATRRRLRGDGRDSNDESPTSSGEEEEESYLVGEEEGQQQQQQRMGLPRTSSATAPTRRGTHHHARGVGGGDATTLPHIRSGGGGARLKASPRAAGGQRRRKVRISTSSHVPAVMPIAVGCDGDEAESRNAVVENEEEEEGADGEERAAIAALSVILTGSEVGSAGASAPFPASRVEAALTQLFGHSSVAAAAWRAVSAVAAAPSDGFEAKALRWFARRDAAAMGFATTTSSMAPAGNSHHSKGRTADAEAEGGGTDGATMALAAPQSFFGEVAVSAQPSGSGTGSAEPLPFDKGPSPNSSRRVSGEGRRMDGAVDYSLTATPEPERGGGVATAGGSAVSLFLNHFSPLPAAQRGPPPKTPATVPSPAPNAVGAAVGGDSSDSGEYSDAEEGRRPPSVAIAIGVMAAMRRCAALASAGAVPSAVMPPSSTQRSPSLSLPPPVAAPHIPNGVAVYGVAPEVPSHHSFVYEGSVATVGAAPAMTQAARRRDQMERGGGVGRSASALVTLDEVLAVLGLGRAEGNQQPASLNSQLSSRHRHGEAESVCGAPLPSPPPPHAALEEFLLLGATDPAAPEGLLRSLRAFALSEGLTPQAVAPIIGAMEEAGHRSEHVSDAQIASAAALPLPVRLYAESHPFGLGGGGLGGWGSTLEAPLGLLAHSLSLRRGLMPMEAYTAAAATSGPPSVAPLSPLSADGSSVAATPTMSTTQRGRRASVAAPHSLLSSGTQPSAIADGGAPLALALGVAEDRFVDYLLQLFAEAGGGALVTTAALRRRAAEAEAAKASNRLAITNGNGGSNIAGGLSGDEVEDDSFVLNTEPMGAATEGARRVPHLQHEAFEEEGDDDDFLIATSVDMPTFYAMLRIHCVNLGHLGVRLAAAAEGDGEASLSPSPSSSWLRKGAVGGGAAPRSTSTASHRALLSAAGRRAAEDLFGPPTAASPSSPPAPLSPLAPTAGAAAPSSSSIPLGPWSPHPPSSAHSPSAYRSFSPKMSAAAASATLDPSSALAAAMGSIPSAAGGVPMGIGLSPSRHQSFAAPSFATPRAAGATANVSTGCFGSSDSDPPPLGGLFAPFDALAPSPSGAMEATTADVDGGASSFWGSPLPTAPATIMGGAANVPASMAMGMSPLGGGGGGQQVIGRARGKSMRFGGGASASAGGTSGAGASAAASAAPSAPPKTPSQRLMDRVARVSAPSAATVPAAIAEGQRRLAAAQLARSQRLMAAMGMETIDGVGRRGAGGCSSDDEDTYADNNMCIGNGRRSGSSANRRVRVISQKKGNSGGDDAVLHLMAGGGSAETTSSLAPCGGTDEPSPSLAGGHQRSSRRGKAEAEAAEEAAKKGALSGGSPLRVRAGSPLLLAGVAARLGIVPPPAYSPVTGHRQPSTTRRERSPSPHTLPQRGAGPSPLSPRHSQRPGTAPSRQVPAGDPLVEGHTSAAGAGATAAASPPPQRSANSRPSTAGSPSAKAEGAQKEAADVSSVFSRLYERAAVPSQPRPATAATALRHRRAAGADAMATIPANSTSQHLSEDAGPSVSPSQLRKKKKKRAAAETDAAEAPSPPRGPPPPRRSYPRGFGPSSSPAAAGANGTPSVLAEGGGAQAAADAAFHEMLMARYAQQLGTTTRGL